MQVNLDQPDYQSYYTESGCSELVGKENSLQRFEEKKGKENKARLFWDAQAIYFKKHRLFEE